MGKNLENRECNSGTVWGNCGSLDVALWDKEIGRKVDVRRDGTSFCFPGIL